jgi:glycosyltransferase involved in cell wall biosynthesis
MGLADIVSCIGWQDDVRPYLIAGDLLVHPAEFEGFPLAIIEAMAHGLPCAVSLDVASEIGLLTEHNVVILNGATELEEEIRQPMRLAARAEEARRVYDRHLSVGSMVDSYQQTYDEARYAVRLLAQ